MSKAPTTKIAKVAGHLVGKKASQAGKPLSCIKPQGLRTSSLP
jgi:hypothetical protein